MNLKKFLVDFPQKKNSSELIIRVALRASFNYINGEAHEVFKDLRN